MDFIDIMLWKYNVAYQHVISKTLVSNCNSWITLPPPLSWCAHWWHVTVHQDWHVTFMLACLRQKFRISGHSLQSSPCCSEMCCNEGRLKFLLSFTRKFLFLHGFAVIILCCIYVAVYLCSGILVEGIGSLLDGIMGTGNGTTSTSINVGVVGLTKVCAVDLWCLCILLSLHSVPSREFNWGHMLEFMWWRHYCDVTCTRTQSVSAVFCSSVFTARCYA